MQHKREWERKQYRQDITQAFETDFVKAQGADKAREMGWDEDSIRKWG